MRIYPRLSESDGRARLQLLRDAPQRQMIDFVEFEHPSATPVATGGVPITAEELAGLRRHVMEQVEPWTAVPFLARSATAAFDRTLGRALHTGMDIVPSDAAHSGVWTFLTVMVFPDVLARRFSDMSDERALGGQRNVLRRTWEREEVLGDLQSAADKPLVEDELVGLFERTALSRNRELVRALARRVLTYGGTQRTAFARELFKEATYLTGPLLLDGLSPDQLQELVDGIEVAVQG